MDANQTFGSVITNSSFTTTSMTFENLTAGYYILKVFAAVPGSFTYQSDPFSCPSFYDLNFPDQMQIYEACSPKPTATIISETSEDHTTRNIILIAVFSAVAGVGLIALIIFFAKKGTAVSITGVSSNDSSQVNIEDAGSSPKKKAKYVQRETIQVERSEVLKNLWTRMICQPIVLYFCSIKPALWKLFRVVFESHLHFAIYRY